MSNFSGFHGGRHPPWCQKAKHGEEDGAAEPVAARQAGCEGIVVSFLHTRRNPAHEAAAATVVRLDPVMTVFGSSEV